MTVFDVKRSSETVEPLHKFGHVKFQFLAALSGKLNESTVRLLNHKILNSVSFIHVRCELSSHKKNMFGFTFSIFKFILRFSENL